MIGSMEHARYTTSRIESKKSVDTSPTCNIDRYAERTYMRYVFYKDDERITCSFASEGADAVGKLQTVTTEKHGKQTFYNLTREPILREKLADKLKISENVNIDATVWFLKNNRTPHETGRSTSTNQEFIAINRQSTDPLPIIWGNASTVNIFDRSTKPYIQFQHVETTMPTPIVTTEPTKPKPQVDTFIPLPPLPDDMKPTKPTLKQKFQSFKDRFRKKEVEQRPYLKITDDTATVNITVGKAEVSFVYHTPDSNQPALLNEIHYHHNRTSISANLNDPDQDSIALQIYKHAQRQLPGLKKNHLDNIHDGRRIGYLLSAPFNLRSAIDLAQTKQRMPNGLESQQDTYFRQNNIVWHNS